MTTTNEHLDQILRRLPPRYEASEAILSASAAQLALVLNNARDGFRATGFFEAAEAQWLTLHATGYGLVRATGETDASLRGRLRNVGDSLTRPALLAAVDALLVARGTAVAAIMIEWFARDTVLDTLTFPYPFIISRSYLVTRTNSFIIIVPDFGDLTDPVYSSILNEVERLRAGGVRWSLVVDGAP